MTPEASIPGTFEERAEKLVDRVFGGLHHVFSLKKEKVGERSLWSFIWYGSVATYDFAHLTRLVFAAHEYAIRVELSYSRAGTLRVLLHERRNRVSEHTWDRHPTIEKALEEWRQMGRREIIH